MKLSSLLLLLALSGCSKTKASDLAAKEVGAPTPGYKCFAIMDGDKPVGGNCVKE